MTLVAVGLALVAYGVLTWLGDTVGYHGDHVVVATAGALAALGLVVLGLGIAGWRAGFVGFLAVCAVLLTAALSVVPTGVRVGGEVGDQFWQPVAVGSDTSFRLAAGNARLDLGALPTTGLTGRTIPVSIGAGNLTIVVPQDRTVDLRTHVGAGNITFPAGVGTGSRQESGTDVSRQAVIGSGPAEVTVDARVGIGQITVVRE
jgi:hypothetical protein